MRCFRLELNRMLRSGKLKVAMAIGTLFVFAHLFVVLRYAGYNEKIVYDNMQIPFSSFMFFFGYDMYGWQSTIFYHILPILAAIPYANSYYLDKTQGYIKNILIRERKSTYLISKYITVFLSGALVMGWTLFLDYLMCTAFLPSYLPQAGSGMFPFTTVSLYYEHPWLYLAGYFLLDMIFAGTYAVMVLPVTNFLENRYLLILFPYVFLLIWQFAGEIYPKLGEIWPVALSLPTYAEKSGAGISCVGYLVGIFVITFGAYYMGGRKEDVF